MAKLLNLNINKLVLFQYWARYLSSITRKFIYIFNCQGQSTSINSFSHQRQWPRVSQKLVFICSPWAGFKKVVIKLSIQKHVQCDTIQVKTNNSSTGDQTIIVKYEWHQWQMELKSDNYPWLGLGSWILVCFTPEEIGSLKWKIENHDAARRNDRKEIMWIKCYICLCMFPVSALTYLLFCFSLRRKATVTTPRYGRPEMPIYGTGETSGACTAILIIIGKPDGKYYSIYLIKTLASKVLTLSVLHYLYRVHL